MNKKNKANLDKKNKDIVNNNNNLDLKDFSSVFAEIKTLAIINRDMLREPLLWKKVSLNHSLTLKVMLVFK